MGYLEQILGDQEQIRFETRRHWFIFFARIVFELVLCTILLIAIVVILNLEENAGSEWSKYKPIIAGILGVFALGVVFSAIIDYLRWSNERYILTDRRVIHLRGIVNKSTIDSSLDKINDVQMSQTIFGRMFDYGDLEILTASEEGMNRLDHIAHPLDFKREMLNTKAEHEGYLRPPGAAAYEGAPPRVSQQDIEGMLLKLADLRQKGLISDDEFNQKRQDLLNRI
jgi:uncharacterized membrane protein YdbT with pleckstrin-like domain